MIEEFLIHHVWIAMILSAILYVTDHYLGLYEAYLYHNHANAYIVFDEIYGGYEKFTEPGHRKWAPSSSFLIVLVIVSLGIYLSWSALVEQYNRYDVFSLILGGLFLFRAASGVVHFRRIALFRFATIPGDIKGKIEYSKHMTSTLLYLDFYGITFLYLMLFIIQGGWFLLGGILTCFIAARRHRDWVVVKT